MTGVRGLWPLVTHRSSNHHGDGFRDDVPIRVRREPTTLPAYRLVGPIAIFGRNMGRTTSPSMFQGAIAVCRGNVPISSPITDPPRTVTGRAVRTFCREFGRTDWSSVALAAPCADAWSSADISDADAMRWSWELPTDAPGAPGASAFPTKAVPSCGRRTDAELSTATSPTSDQRVGSVEQPLGCSRRAQRVGAPQGPEDFGERSDAKVYGATPFVAAKETTTLPKVHWGGGRSRGNGSPSGESPKASWGAATKSMHPTIDVERGEA